MDMFDKMSCPFALRDYDSGEVVEILHYEFYDDGNIKIVDSQTKKAFTVDPGYPIDDDNRIYFAIDEKENSDLLFHLADFNMAELTGDKIEVDGKERSIGKIHLAYCEYSVLSNEDLFNLSMDEGFMNDLFVNRRVTTVLDENKVNLDGIKQICMEAEKRINERRKRAHIKEKAGTGFTLLEKSFFDETNDSDYYMVVEDNGERSGLDLLNRYCR